MEGKIRRGGGVYYPETRGKRGKGWRDRKRVIALQLHLMASLERRRER